LQFIRRIIQTQISFRDADSLGGQDAPFPIDKASRR